MHAHKYVIIYTCVCIDFFYISFFCKLFLEFLRHSKVYHAEILHYSQVPKYNIKASR